MSSKISIILTAALAMTLLISGCGQLEFGIETQPPLTSAVDPDKTPVAGTGVTVKDAEGSETHEPDPSAAAYWSEAADDRTGVRFAVPCFWEVQLPVLDPTGLGALFVRNYDEEFIQSQPRGIVWDSGGIKIDMIYIEGSSLGLPLSAPLIEVAGSLGDATTGLVSAEEVVINGQEALRFESQGMNDETPAASYLFRLGEDLYLLFGASPSGAMEIADVQAILHSLAISEGVSVQIPGVIPSPAPEGVSAPCMKDLQTSPSTEPVVDESPCASALAGSAEELYCELQQALLGRDIEQLRSLMNDPFVIGYWQSEGTSGTPEYSAAMIDDYMLPADTSGLTFTTERSQFPPLFGQPPENMFGPDVDVALVVYSEGWGWGEEGMGAALLYITDEGGGSYTWFGMVIDGEHFDK